MHYNYDGLLNAAANMEQYTGYLDGEELKASQQATAQFNSIRNRFVFDALAREDDAEEVKARIVGDLDSFAEENPGWAGPAGLVRDELVARIDGESLKKPAWRKVVRYAPVALGVVLAIGYFGTKVYSDIDLSPAQDTPAGVAARAQALEKTLRYDDWSSTRSRRGGLFQSVLLWPISPSDLEVQAAQDIAGFAYSAEAFLREQQIACNFLTRSSEEELNDSETAYLWGIADRLQSPTLTWDDDVQITMLQEAAGQLSCPGFEIDFGAGAEPDTAEGNSVQ